MVFLSKIVIPNTKEVKNVMIFKAIINNLNSITVVYKWINKKMKENY